MKKIITFSILSYLLFTINSNAINEGSSENNLENSNFLKIGVLLPLSGKFQDIGESFLKAIQLALYDISNENIKIYPKDSKGNALNAYKSAKEFEEQGIQIVIGPIFYENLERLGEINNITFISLTNKNIVGIALGMENGAPIQGDLSRVEYYYDRGIRYITLTHSKTNHISDSSYDENIQWHGLSEFGKTLIEEMNRVGLMIDISHVNDEAFYQAIELSQVPVIASHSSLRHFTPGFERNVDDAMLNKLAEKGGVLQINFGSSFVSQRPRDYMDLMNNFLELKFGQSREDVSEEVINEARKEFFSKNKYPYATLDEVLGHFDRVVNLVGVDHVGIGSDYDGVGDTLPIGLKDVSSYPSLIEGFLERGYSREDIDKILGGNLIRVWKEVEEYANRN